MGSYLHNWSRVLLACDDTYNDVICTPNHFTIPSLQYSNCCRPTILQVLNL